MRIAIFSDIHANLNGLDAVLEDIRLRGGADILVAAGDLATDGPRPCETLDRLIESGCLMIRGNHDEYLLGRGKEMIQPEKRENLWLQTLWATRQVGAKRLAILQQQPFQRTFSPSPGIEGHDLLAVHANLRSVYGWTGHLEQKEEILEELYGNAPANVEVIAFGHWHSNSVRRWHGMKLVNVASVAYPKDRSRLASYTLFTWNNHANIWQFEQHRVPFNWREEAQLLRESGMPGHPWHLKEYYFEPQEDLEQLESVA